MELASGGQIEEIVVGGINWELVSGKGKTGFSA